jgi:hypothetical protein
VLPQLPGSAFAASVVTGVQDFAGSVIGNVTDFTSNITNRTNPVPVTTTRRSGGGRSGGGSVRLRLPGCACACAVGAVNREWRLEIRDLDFQGYLELSVRSSESKDWELIVSGC